ncbi:MAG TPA: tryptophan synthase subunit alpha [Blastocatellia bacterium]|nr:tryptophan synthase subunit alpha [Blastocatellia bacterium]
MSRIEAKFKDLRREGRKAFIPYITAGDPDLETTARLIVELERSGADVIELGVPFSDPMADGPAIQRAMERALKNRVSVRDCLDVIRQVRKQSEVPILIFSYLNPLLALGQGSIGRDLRDAGADGVLATDLIPEEASAFVEPIRAAGLDTIFLAAPTSADERLKLICEWSSGFIYALSRKGVTGVKPSLWSGAMALVRRVRRYTELPIAVGFGISTPELVAEVWRHADAAVVGSLIVREIEKLATDPALVEKVGALARWLVSERA